jgi:manganese/zinc/iron transport system permease protein
MNAMLDGWSIDGATAMHAWAIATAAVVAAACALVGTLLVVRRMSLLGDAIGHAVLPGIAVAVLAGGRPGSPLVFAAAVATGLLTVWLTRLVRSAGSLSDDAGTGVVFTTLFALGVVIVTAAASRIDLDPSCMLYGILELVPFDTVSIGGIEVPQGFVSAGLVLVGLAAAAIATWKLQVFTAFDADAARAAGVPVAAVTGGLLAATALATVAGFEVVGAVLVVVGTGLGYLAAWRWNASAAGMIAVVLGLEYVAAVVLAPDDGLVARGLGRLGYAWRVACEDRLAAVWRAEEKGAAAATPVSLVQRLAMGWLTLTGRCVGRFGSVTLSAAGRREAEMVVRSHRLWEAWLGQHAQLPLDHLHPPAEWVEHHLGAAMRQRIEAEVGAAGDPHGSEIPPEA